MRQVQEAIVVWRQRGVFERVADGGPLLREVVHVWDDPEILEDHFGAFPLQAVGAVAGVEVLQDEDFGAQRAQRREGSGKVVFVQMLLGSRRGEGRRKVVIVEGVFKGNCVVRADGTALFLKPHENRLGRVPVQKGKDIQQDLLVAKARIPIRMVDVQLIIAQPRADIQIAQPALQLHGQIPVLALQLLRANLVRHGVVRAGDAEARDVHVVRDGGHPGGVILVAGVEAVEGLVAAVAGGAGGAGPAQGDERVEERHGEHEDEGYEAGGEAAATRGTRLRRAKGLDGE